ncbi:ChrR family anti-sigma-E factor [Thalassococcus sp. S3]|uniref:ChrR family anti-sigma-E factor n=1 Tax=Thalassococcus sp. S3 TaxID=2017482 RepID=UPI0010249009|nr:ChrR family anti-sigma-E factor [Thalassococcus sp. S3]QBF33719.1 transcriptional regulator [Thalassococcus sp. S3]
MTQQIKHHLTDEILMAYSAGTLPEAFNLMVASHISLCDTCRAQLEAFDALGGALLEEQREDVADLDATALEATMALIAGGAIETAPTFRRPEGILPGPLQDYVGGDLDAIEWRGAGMGVKQAILPTSSEASARLLYIPAGAAMPDHGHKGTEMTMVLKGAFIDEDDRFARGDVECADEHLQHTPVADIGEDCICLAVTDAPLKFNGLIPRIAQPFLRI